MHPLQTLMETQRHQAGHLQRQAHRTRRTRSDRPEPAGHSLRRRLAVAIAVMSKRG
jgi:hypothetical protein